MGRLGLILALFRPFLRGGRAGARGIVEVAPGVVSAAGRSPMGTLALVALTVAMLAPYIDYGKVQTDIEAAGAFIDQHDEAVIAAGADMLNMLLENGAAAWDRMVSDV